MKISYNIKQEYEHYTIRRFLRVNFSHLSQAAIHKFLRTGDIKVNGKKADIEYILQLNDNVQIWDQLVKPMEEKEISSKKEYQFLQPCIIDRKENYWIINKPCGLAMQGGINVSTSLDYLLTGFMLDWDPDAKPHLVHRLDRYTSGVCIVATNHHAAFAITNQFKHRKMQKTYIALCHNFTNTDLMRNHTFTLKDPIDDKEAVTHCVVRGVYKDNRKAEGEKDLLLIEFKPVTGRKHQIRKHCVINNLPICGDRTYYPETSFTQMHLHSYILEHTFVTDLVPAFVYKAPFPKHMKDYEQFFL